jgi:phosphopantetheinyl transferase (holo-ACP synthase)
MITSKYKYESSWGGFPRHALAIFLDKPIEPSDLKRQVPHLKAISINFNTKGFAPIKIDHEQYLLELLDYFDFEEIKIGNNNRLIHIPDKIWQPTLEFLSVGQSSVNPVLQLNPKLNLQGLAINCNDVEIDESFFASPHLRKLSLSNVKYDLAALNPNMEVISIHKSERVLAFDLSKMKNLRELELNNVQVLHDNPSFEFLTKLEYVTLNEVNCSPKNWSNSKSLKKVQISEIPPLSLHFDIFPSLEEVSINVGSVAGDNFLGEMPQLKYLHLSIKESNTLRLNPELFSSEDLYSIWLTNCLLPQSSIQPELLHTINLSAIHLDRNEDFLKHFAGITISNMSFEDIDCSKLTDLKRFTSFDYTGATLPVFSTSNISLKSIQVQRCSLTQIPQSWTKCPNLETLEFYANTLFDLPVWEEFDSLKALKVTNIKVPVEVMLWKNLSRLEYSGNTGTENIGEFQNDIVKITSDQNLDKATKLLIGSMMMYNEEIFAKTFGFKETFLKIFRCKSQKFKQLAWQHLDCLNDKTSMTLNELAQKSVGILGKSKNNKTYYKEKLTALGCHYEAKIKSQTEVIVVGEDFEVPNKFWDFPHHFITEVVLENLLKDFQPGYIQSLEMNELSNLRQLMWSDEPENDRLVLEMVKGGGTSGAILPDLIVVAKTSKDDGVKSGLKKILKAKLDVGGQKILSDKINLRNPPSYRHPFETYQHYGSSLDISQIALTWAKRGYGSYAEFFSISQSKQNPYRQEVFFSIYHQFLERPHYVAIHWNFTSTELHVILSNEALAGKLKRLILRYVNLTEIIPSLLLHQNTLEDFECSTNEQELPAALSQLKKLKKLKIDARNLERLPTAWAGLVKLKECFLYNNKAIKLPIVLEGLTKITRFYCSGGYTFEQT